MKKFKIGKKWQIEFVNDDPDEFPDGFLCLELIHPSKNAGFFEDNSGFIFAYKEDEENGGKVHINDFGLIEQSYLTKDQKEELENFGLKIGSEFSSMKSLLKTIEKLYKEMKNKKK